MTIKEKLKAPSLLTTTLLLTILNALIVVTLLGKGVLDYAQGIETKDQIVIENVNSKDVDQISSLFAYASNDNKSESYYSSSLDITFKYDSSKYKLRDSDTYVSISLKGYNGLDFISTLRSYPLSIEDPEKYLTQYYANIYGEITIDERVTVEGIPSFQISYLKNNLLGSSKKVVINRMFVYKKFKDRYLVSDTLFPKNFDIVDFSSETATLINTVNTNIDDFDTVTNLDIGATEISIQYDRKLWNLTSSKTDSATLQYRDSYKRLNGFISDKDTISISTAKRTTNDKKVSEYLEEMKIEAGVKYKDLGFKISQNINEIDLLGSKFSHIQYSYDLPTKTNTDLYMGELPNSNTLVIIKQTLSNSKKEVISQFNKVLQSLTVEKLSIPLTDSNNTSKLEVSKAAILAKTAAVHIYNKTCVDIDVTSDSNLPTIKGNFYQVCMANLGTGTYISNNGHIVTNGSLVKPDPIDTLSKYLLKDLYSLPEFWRDLIADTNAKLVDSGFEPSRLNPDELTFITLDTFYTMVKNGEVILTPKYTNYVENETSFLIDPITFSLLNPESHIVAETVEGKADSQAKTNYKLALGEASSVSKPDIALIKVQTTFQTPGLPLSTVEKVTPDQLIYELYFENSTTPEITVGSINNVKLSVNEAFKQIRIEPKTPFTSSYGPIVNLNGEIVGLTSYKVSSIGHEKYNVGVSVDEALKLVEANSVSKLASDSTKYLVSGLDNFKKSYFKLASADFNNAKKAYPTMTEIVNPMISISNSAVTNGSDKTPLINIESLESYLYSIRIQVQSNYLTLLIITLVGLFLSSITTLTLVFLRKSGYTHQTGAPVFGNPQLNTDKKTVQVQTHTEIQTPSTPTNVINLEETPQQIPVKQPTEEVKTPPQPVQSSTEALPVDTNVQKQDASPTNTDLYP